MPRTCSMERATGLSRGSGAPRHASVDRLQAEVISTMTVPAPAPVGRRARPIPSSNPGASPRGHCCARCEVPASKSSSPGRGYARSAAVSHRQRTGSQRRARAPNSAAALHVHDLPPLTPPRLDVRQMPPWSKRQSWRARREPSSLSARVRSDSMEGVRRTSDLARPAQPVGRRTLELVVDAHPDWRVERRYTSARADYNRRYACPFSGS
jgi:hypothetical protein